MTLFTSMGGCGSTTFIAWFAKRIRCNCPFNSEGLPKPGPGSNPLGLKHRATPPAPNDPYVPAGQLIERGVFLFDSPSIVVPSLFRRRIATGHAIAITGKKPEHDNDLDRFLELGRDSFGFAQQFGAWICPAAYPCLLVRASALWEHLPDVLDFVGLPAAAAAAFPPRRPRESSFAALSPAQQQKMRQIYGELDRRIGEMPDLSFRT